MISETGRRLAPDPEPRARESVTAPIAPRTRPSPDVDPDPDVALSLSSASLRLARQSAQATELADPASGPRRPGASNRAIDAYREIARAPIGDRIRILA